VIYLFMNRFYRLQECADAHEQYMLEFLKFYNNIFFEDNIKYSEYFKQILDTSKSYYRNHNLI
jgi:hypothetical protein